MNRIEIEHQKKTYLIEKEIEDLVRLIWSQDYDICDSRADLDGQIVVQFPDIDQFQDLIQRAHSVHVIRNKDVKGDTFTNFMKYSCHLQVLIRDNGSFEIPTQTYRIGPYTYLITSLSFPKALKAKFMDLWKSTFTEIVINETDSPDEIETFFTTNK